MLAATQPFTKGCALCHAPAKPMSSSSRSFVIAAERARPSGKLRFLRYEPLPAGIRGAGVCFFQKQKVD